MEQKCDVIRIRPNDAGLIVLLYKIYELIGADGNKLVKAIREVDGSKDFVIFPKNLDSQLIPALLSILNDFLENYLSSAEIVGVIEQVKFVEILEKVRLEN